VSKLEKEIKEKDKKIANLEFEIMETKDYEEASKEKFKYFEILLLEK
jgi:hypothetical protein